MKSTQNQNKTQIQVINIEKTIQAIKVLRTKVLIVPAEPLARGRVLRELADEIIVQLEINDYLTISAVNALVEIFDKPLADTVYTALIQDLEHLSKLKLQELKLELRSLYELKLTTKLQRLSPDEFRQHIQVLKSLRFKFDDILKLWYKLYEAGKPVAHPLA